MALTLEELLLGKLDEVRRAIITQRVLFIGEGASERFARVFDWNGIDTVLRGENHSPGDFSMFFGGKALDLQFMGVFDADGCFRPERFRSLTQQGATLGGAHLERSFPEIAALANQLRASFSAVVRCAFVASYGNVPGYPVHYDCDDLIICQASGRKRWEFFGTPVAGSGYPYRDEGTPGEAGLALELGPGDVLIVPSGLRHRCTPLEPSLHFGFAMTWPTGVWIARQLMEATVGRVVAREPLRSFAPEDERRALEQAVREELMAVLNELDLREACAQFLVRFPPGDQGKGRRERDS